MDSLESGFALDHVLLPITGIYNKLCNSFQPYPILLSETCLCETIQI